MTGLYPAIAFASAFTVWSVYFYVIDWLIMAGQGLTVGWNLMPPS